MPETLKADLCVIGAGSAGLSVASGAAMLGQKVILIEGHAMGGDCLNVGCVPSKALIAAGKRAEAIRTAAPFGVEAREPAIDYARVMEHVRETIAAIAPVDSVGRYRALGCTVIEAKARFLDGATVEAGGTRISARRFLIATGSRPGLPPIPGLAETPHLTNETLWANRTRPAHLVIIGAGPIGLEMAQAHRRLGSAVTVLEAGRALAKDDPEAAGIVLDRLRREGVVIREGVKIDRSDAVPGSLGGGVRLTLAGGETISGSHLLVAAGRLPNVEDLNLGAAGVAFTRKGITTDARMRTSNKRIYAAGDVAGGPQFTHAAGYQAGIVIPNIFFWAPLKASYAALPWATYTDPELAHVGLTEAMAREQGLAGLRILRWPLIENDRARAEREHEGLIKVLVARNGKILGATIAGPHAGDLIQPWTLAIGQGLKIRAMAQTVAAYPTLGEISKRAAGQFYAGTLFSPRVRAIVKFLARFG